MGKNEPMDILASLPEKSFYSTLENCIRVYSKVFKDWNPIPHRMLGFRTTGGIDRNDIYFSI